MTTTTQDHLTVSFTGTQTIAQAEEARARLLDLLAQRDQDLCVDCHAVEVCDLAFAQVLIAARRSVLTKGASLRLIGSPALAAACAAAGIDLQDLAGPARAGTKGD